MSSTHMTKWFTLIEMLLVIVVLWVLISMSRYLFVASDNNKYYAETCANNIYSTLKNHQYKALVGKKLNTWSWTLTPQSYNMQIDAENNTIALQYNTWSSIATYNTINLNDAHSSRLCKNQSYQVILSGDDFSTLNIAFAKNLSSPWITMQKDQDTAYTGTITIIQQETNINTSKEVAQIRIDTRNQNITRHICFIVDKASGTCTKRQH